MRQPTKMNIPAYFSHSYRFEDRDVNLKFWKLFSDAGFIFSVDPKSDVLSATYLEFMMQRSVCFAAVITKRTGEADLCSPFMRYEYGLAVQARKPKIVFVEDGVSGRLFEDAPNVYAFKRSRLVHIKDDFGKIINEFAAHNIGNRRGDVSLLRKAGILLPVSSGGAGVYNHDIIEAISDELSRAGFVSEVVNLNFNSNYELAIKLDKYDFVLVDVLSGYPADWIVSFIQGRFVPMMRLAHTANGTGQAISSLPSLFRGQLIADRSPGEALIFWNDKVELLRNIGTHLAKFTYDRIEFIRHGDGVRYFRSIGRHVDHIFISNAGESEELARALCVRLSLDNFQFFHYKMNTDIPVGVEWREALVERVERSRIFVALITPDYWESPWCQLEWHLAQKQAAEGGMVIIPYFLDRGGVFVPIQGRDITGMSKNIVVNCIASDLDAQLRRSVIRREGGALRGPASVDVAVAKPEKGMNVSLSEYADIAIITILNEEYQAVLDVLESPSRVPGTYEEPNAYAWQIGQVYSPQYKRHFRVVVALSTQQGNSASAICALTTLTRWKPRHVLLVGIAGGLSGGETDPREIPNKGDVVVSSVIWGYEYGKVKDKFFPRNDHTFPVDGSLLRAADSIKNSTKWHSLLKISCPDVANVAAQMSGPKVLLGAAASGDKVIDDISNPFAAQILERWPKLKAIEMEGAGAATAIAAAQTLNRNTGFLMVRGISDVPYGRTVPSGRRKAEVAEGSTSNASERDQWKRFAAASAAAFSVELIRSAWPGPPALQD